MPTFFVAYSGNYFTIIHKTKDSNLFLTDLENVGNDFSSTITHLKNDFSKSFNKSISFVATDGAYVNLFLLNDGSLRYEGYDYDLPGTDWNNERVIYFPDGNVIKSIFPAPDWGVSNDEYSLTSYNYSYRKFLALDVNDNGFILQFSNDTDTNKTAYSIVTVNYDLTTPKSIRPGSSKKSSYYLLFDSVYTIGFLDSDTGNVTEFNINNIVDSKLGTLEIIDALNQFILVKENIGSGNYNYVVYRRQRFDSDIDLSNPYTTAFTRIGTINLPIDSSKNIILLPVSQFPYERSIDGAVSEPNLIALGYKNNVFDEYILNFSLHVLDNNYTLLDILPNFQPQQVSEITSDNKEAKYNTMIKSFHCTLVKPKDSFIDGERIVNLLYSDLAGNLYFLYKDINLFPNASYLVNPGNVGISDWYWPKSVVTREPYGYGLSGNSLGSFAIGGTSPDGDAPASSSSQFVTGNFLYPVNAYGDAAYGTAAFGGNSGRIRANIKSDNDSETAISRMWIWFRDYHGLIVPSGQVGTNDFIDYDSMKSKINNPDLREVRRSWPNQSIKFDWLDYKREAKIVIGKILDRATIRYYRNYWFTTRPIMLKKISIRRELYNLLKNMGILI